MMKQLRCMPFNRLWVLIVIAACFIGCQSEYQQYVDQELATGITQDSLFLDMRIGQTRKDFYSICWDLNKQGLISEGTGNTTARYITDRDSSGVSTPASKDILFYGIFDEDDIMRGMEMTYSYVTWAPWNEEKQADQLLLNLRDEYLINYPGNDFIEIDIKASESPALVKIDGNRQILMYVKNKKDVAVKIEDLHFKLNDQWEKD